MRAPIGLGIVALVATACFEDTPPAMGGTQGATAGDDDGVDDDDDADETSNAGTVSVRGVVNTSFIDTMAPAVGAKVQLVDDPSISAITDELGEFELAGVPAGQLAWIAVPRNETYIGAIVGVDVPFVDVTDVAIGRADRLSVQTVLDMLETQDPSVSLDDTAGAIVVLSSAAQTIVTLDPMPLPGNYYGYDGLMPILNLNGTTFPLQHVVFFNIAPVDAGTVKVSVDHPTQSCTVPFSQPPIVADHFTLLAATCQ